MVEPTTILVYGGETFNECDATFREAVKLLSKECIAPIKTDCRKMEIKTEHVTAKLVREVSDSVRGARFDEVFGFDPIICMYLRKRNNKPPYKGTWIEYIKEKERS